LNPSPDLPEVSTDDVADASPLRVLDERLIKQGKKWVKRCVEEFARIKSALYDPIWYCQSLPGE
jgi:hypothetical protein